MKVINVNLLFSFVTFMVVGCNDSTCVKFIEDEGGVVEPVYVYALSPGEYSEEMSRVNELFPGEVSGRLVREVYGGETCLTNEDVGIFESIKIVAPYFRYSDALKYYPDYDSIPSIVVFKKK